MHATDFFTKRPVCNTISAAVSATFKAKIASAISLTPSLI